MEITNLYELSELVGPDKVINELQQWMSTDQIKEFINDYCKLNFNDED